MWMAPNGYQNKGMKFAWWELNHEKGGYAAWRRHSDDIVERKGYKVTQSATLLEDEWIMHVQLCKRHAPTLTLSGRNGSGLSAATLWLLRLRTQPMDYFGDTCWHQQILPLICPLNWYPAYWDYLWRLDGILSKPPFHHSHSFWAGCPRIPWRRTSTATGKWGRPS